MSFDFRDVNHHCDNWKDKDPKLMDHEEGVQLCWIHFDLICFDLCSVNQNSRGKYQTAPDHGHPANRVTQ